MRALNFITGLGLLLAYFTWFWLELEDGPHLPYSLRWIYVAMLGLGIVMAILGILTKAYRRSRQVHRGIVTEANG